MSKKAIIRAISLAPLWLNYIILKLNVYPDIMFGKKYKEVVENFENFPEQDFLSFFKRTAIKNCYYKTIYGDSLLHIHSIEDYKNTIQFTDKDIALSNFETIASANTDGAEACTTGGTSGKPLKIILPKSRYINELGSLHALWSKVGYEFSVRAVMRNEKLSGRDYIINPITREFIFDGFRTDETYLISIYKVMKKYRIPFFHGYTSNAEKFANLILDKNLDYNFLKGIITSSENLYEHQRHLFSKLQGVHHMNFFGHSEKLILGGWCESGNCYHFYNSYGYAELVDTQGMDIKTPGQIGELVGSTAYNEYMPLFRYKTGDYAEKAPDVCVGCGFIGLSAYKILGRWKGERIYNKDGSYVTTTALNLHSGIYDHIEALQYYQPKKGHLEIRVVTANTYSHQIEKQLIDSVTNKLKEDSLVYVRKVLDVEKKSNGKYLLLISDLG